MSSNIEQKIEIWKNKLLDLGKRNRLINYRETKRSTLSIKKPDAFSLWNSLVQNDKPLEFPYYYAPLMNTAGIIDERRTRNVNTVSSENVITNQSVEELQKTLRSLRSKARIAIEEQGVNILYLAFGFIKWTEAEYSDEQLISPLILVPVKLTVASVISPFVLQKTDDEIVVNPTLKLKLSSEFGIVLPEFEEEEFDLENYLNTVQKIVENNANWTVSSEVGLSLFSFLKINMYEDLERNKDHIVSHQVVRAIAGDSSATQHIPEDINNYDFDKKLAPKEVFQVLDADSSQQEAILFAKQGFSFVLQGPPGSGKSQTIANIITELLAEGKKVLFVAEKMAALDVVYKRLSSAGLQDFCMVLHSCKANKKDVLEQLRTTLALSEKKNTNPNEALDDLDNLYLKRERLNQYAEQIFSKIPPLDKTIYEVNGILAKLHVYEDVSFEIENIGEVDSERYHQYIAILEEYQGVVKRMSWDIINNPWRDSNIQFVTNELRHDIQARLPSTADQLVRIADVMQASLSSVNLDIECSWEGLKGATELLAVAQNSPKIPRYWIKNILEEDDNYLRIPEAWRPKNKVDSLLDEISELEEKTSSFNEKVTELQGTYFEINTHGLCNLKLQNTDDLNSSEALDSEQVVLDQFLKDNPVLSRIASQEDLNTLLNERQKAEEQINRSKAIKETLERQFTDNIYSIESQDIFAGYYRSYHSFESEIPQDVAVEFLFHPFMSFPLIPDKWLWEDITEIRNNAQICEKEKNEFYDKAEKLTKLLSTLTQSGYRLSFDNNQFANSQSLIEIRNSLKILFQKHPAMKRIMQNSLFDSCRKELTIARKKAEAIQTLKAKLSQDFERDVFSLDYETMLKSHILDSKSLWRFLKPRYRRNRNQMILLYKRIDRKIDDLTIISALRDLKEIANIRSEMDRECNSLITAFGAKFQYEESDYQSIDNELNAYAQIVQAYKLTNEMLVTVSKFDPQNEELTLQFSRWYKGLDTQWEHIRSALDWVVKFRKQIGEDKVILKSCLKNKDEEFSEQSVFQALTSLDELRQEKESFERLYDRFISTFDNLLKEENTDFHLIDNHIKTYQALVKGRTILDKMKVMMREFVSNEQSLKEHYDFLYDRMATSWTDIRKALEWTNQFKNVTLKYLPNEEFIELVCSDSEAIDICKELSLQLPSMLQDLESNFQWFIGLFNDSNYYTQMDFHEASNRFRQFSQSVPILEEWIVYKNVRNTCEKSGLQDYIQQVEKQRIEPDHIPNVFSKRFFHLWLDAVLPDYPAVMDFRRKKQEDTIRQFSRLDKLQFEIAKARIRNILINTLPEPFSLTSGRDEIDVLRRELGKQRRIMPLRKLFRQIPNLLLNLKPCLMMSPLSVSLFLESNAYQFDVIIFDEASQICTENAIGAIIRGRQAIIAGDSKQLPPTNFFTASVSDNDDYDSDNEEEEEEEEDSSAYESILDEANQLPERKLLWHYRSRHEHLIAFSNAKFYKNELITFPSNIEQAPNNGVEYVYVKDGVYDRGGKKGNIQEAKRVADLVFKHFKDHPERSLGVIAFGETQQQAIETAIREMRMRDSQYEDFFNEEKEEPFFIKNLENVQGDERDTVIFSIGYAKNNRGVFYMNFGPLNKTGGERRLNVAITRAKYNVKLVGSILPTEIDLNRTNAKGPALLRSYIEFAINGAESLLRETTESETAQHDSPFEKEVYDFLLQKGYNMSTQVGCSGYRIDMAVKHPTISGQYVIGIECDGASYHSARTARERDRLRQDVLESMGWKLYRIWSTDWIKNTQIEENRLVTAVENAIKSYEDKTSITDTAE